MVATFKRMFNHLVQGTTEFDSADLKAMQGYASRGCEYLADCKQHLEVFRSVAGPKITAAITRGMTQHLVMGDTVKFWHVAFSDAMQEDLSDTACLNLIKGHAPENIAEQMKIAMQAGQTIATTYSDLFATPVVHQLPEGDKPTSCPSWQASQPCWRGSSSQHLC